MENDDDEKGEVKGHTKRRDRQVRYQTVSHLCNNMGPHIHTKWQWLTIERVAEHIPIMPNGD